MPRLAQRIRSIADFGGALPFVASAVLLLAGQSALNVRLRGLESTWVEPPYEKSMAWDPAVFKALTFGHWPVAVDWLWIRGMGDPAISRLPKGQHPAVFHDLDLITELDPLFYWAYVAGGNYLAVIRDDTEGALHLIQKGERFRKGELDSYPEEFRQRYWSGAWNLPVLLAYLHLFEFDNLPDAAQAFGEAARSPGAPDYLKRLDERLRAPGGQYEVGLKLLNFLISGAVESGDARARERLEKKRSSLYLSQYLDHLNRSFVEYLKAIPQYRSKTEISQRQMELYWAQFRREQGVASTDPWGGKLHIDEHGEVNSTTPRQRVFGLD